MLPPVLKNDEVVYIKNNVHDMMKGKIIGDGEKPRSHRNRSHIYKASINQTDLSDSSV